MLSFRLTVPSRVLLKRIVTVCNLLTGNSTTSISCHLKLMTVLNSRKTTPPSPKSKQSQLRVDFPLPFIFFFKLCFVALY
jgi:hypothetical protein